MSDRVGAVSPCVSGLESGSARTAPIDVQVEAGALVDPVPGGVLLPGPVGGGSVAGQSSQQATKGARN